MFQLALNPLAVQQKHIDTPRTMRYDIYLFNSITFWLGLFHEFRYNVVRSGGHAERPESLRSVTVFTLHLLFKYMFAQSVNTMHTVCRGNRVDDYLKWLHKFAKAKD